MHFLVICPDLSHVHTHTFVLNYTSKLGAFFTQGINGIGKISLSTEFSN